MQGDVPQSRRHRTVGFRRACLLTITAAVAAVSACAEPSSTSGATPLTFVGAPAATSLTLRDAADGQEGVASTDGEIRLRTAPRTDDDATARLCGVLVGRSRLTERLPFAWSVDSMLPHLAPKILAGGDVYGVRLLVPGVNAAYHFEGFTTDGGTRVSVRWPVRSSGSVPATASDPEIEAVLTPAPTVLDSLVTALRYRDGGKRAAWASARGPSDSIETSRAVRLVRDVPFFPIGFSTACRDATFRTDVNAGTEKAIRVLVDKGDRVAATVSLPGSEASVRFVMGGEASKLGRTTSLTAPDSGFVTLLVGFTANSTAPQRQSVLLRVTSSAH